MAYLEPTMIYEDFVCVLVFRCVHGFLFINIEFHLLLVRRCEMVEQWSIEILSFNTIISKLSYSSLFHHTGIC